MSVKICENQKLMESVMGIINLKR